MKRFIDLLFSLLILFCGIALWYAWRWLPLFATATPQPVYCVHGHAADTLFIAMIGDSWTGMHDTSRSDSAVSVDWSLRIGCPLRFVSCGKGGANSGDVYKLMFHQHLPIDSFSSQSLIQQRPDYCIITVGINDANQNVGTNFYCVNSQLIITHLLRCGIRPVFVEVPDVDLRHVYGDKCLKDRLADTYKAFLTGTSLFNVAEYRHTLRRNLEESKMIDSVLYVSCDMWNPNGYRDTSLYLADRIHLNTKGYSRLDSCLLSVIMNDVDGK